VILEYCTPGSSTGTHTITAGLFEGVEPTATPSKGRGFRLHACPTTKAHSAASFEGKRAVSRSVGVLRRLKGTA
jgi:hypothetical protein